METLLIGAPVRAREWIIERWFDHIEVATLEAVRLGIGRPAYVFVGDRRDPTLELIARRCAAQDRDVRFVHVDEPELVDERTWATPGRFARMAYLRNELLGAVREIGPDLFWSVDSDILVHPRSLVTAIPLLERFAAVGNRCYLTDVGYDAPNWGVWHPGAGGLVRFSDDPEVLGEWPVDIIMAAKLMSPAAYAVDYADHHQGEDIGISLAWKAAGLKVGWCGANVSKHVRRRELLDVVDERCGY